MPVQRCRKNDKPGYKWGNQGTCYTYNSGDDVGRERARSRANAQGAAARAAGYTENIDTKKTGKR